MAGTEEEVDDEGVDPDPDPDPVEGTTVEGLVILEVDVGLIVVVGKGVDETTIVVLGVMTEELDVERDELGVEATWDAVLAAAQSVDTQ